MNIEHPTSNAEHRIASTRRLHSMFDVGRSAFDVFSLHKPGFFRVRFCKTMTNTAVKMRQIGNAQLEEL